ncbi:hypothetical protein [Gimesia chilikensis]|uniref:hypothetical protein n=1 Tax=Gimesia chilikensis TaxID=2605989 RepID=UPI003A8C8B8D
MQTKNHTSQRSDMLQAGGLVERIKFCTHPDQDPILSPKESAISDAFSPHASYDRNPTT